MMKIITQATTVVPLLVFFSVQPVLANDPRRCNAGDFEFCLDGVTSAVTSPDLVRVTGARHADVLLDRERERDDTRGIAFKDEEGRMVSGVMAGDLLGSGWGIWASYSFSDFESRNRIAPYDGDIHSVLFGIDRLFADRLVLGLAGGYETTHTDTFYNAGGQKTDGVTVAPYAAFLINEYFSIDASGGYSWLNNKTNRVHPGSFARLAADFDSGRWFAMTNLNAVYTTGNWTLGGRTGFLYAKENQEGYTETGGVGARTVDRRKVSIAQYIVGADIGYAFGAFEPYALFNYRYDISSRDGRDAGGLPDATGATRADDRDEFEVGVGVRYFGRQGLSGGVEWFKTLGRKQFDNHSVMATLRFDF
jgi:outer membrane autotransporter protein